MNWDWIGWAGILVAIVGFAIGLMQYREAQRWKVAEFVANEFKEFEADPVVSNALTLIDWNPMFLVLVVEPSGRKGPLISHQDIERALEAP